MIKKNSAEFFIKPNIGTRIGKDSQILPIRCFTDIAKNRPDPMSDPIIGWSFKKNITKKIWLFIQIL